MRNLSKAEMITQWKNDVPTTIYDKKNIEKKYFKLFTTSRKSLDFAQA